MTDKPRYVVHVYYRVRAGWTVQATGYDDVWTARQAASWLAKQASGAAVFEINGSVEDERRTAIVRFGDLPSDHSS